uniref:Uncharacterized protein n=1 Tax=Cannabis sativa TaxID=3483 RepID=A0A803NUK2_CANSA
MGRKSKPETNIDALKAEVRVGYPITGYGQESRNRAAFMRIPNRGMDQMKRGSWDSIDFWHPSTFETLAMDEKLKKELVDDLHRFVKRKEFYKRVGSAWKRGYLLFGPLMWGNLA